jgi:hypothetical protein
VESPSVTVGVSQLSLAVGVPNTGGLGQSMVMPANVDVQTGGVVSCTVMV